MQPALGVFLVTERHRTQLHQLVARITHIADVALVTCRRFCAAEQAGVIGNYIAALLYPGAAEDAGDEGGGLRALGADPDGVGLSRKTSVADFDVVITRGERRTGSETNRDVIGPGRVIEQGIGPHS